MYEEIMQKLGLSTNEARMYELLLTKGKVKARDLVEDSGLGRGNVYNILTGLVARGLATVTEGKQQTYQAAEPTKLASLVEEQKRKAERLSAEFADELPKLLSTFNLTTGKPAIRVFEGFEGVKEALDDSLQAKTPILTYYDFSALSTQLQEVDEQYYRAYVRKGLQKEIIVGDSHEARAYFQEALKNTTVYFVPKFPELFGAAMQIYDDTVSFVTLKGGVLITVLLRDPVIAEFMRKMFAFHAQLADLVIKDPSGV